MIFYANVTGEDMTNLGKLVQQQQNQSNKKLK